MMGIQLILSLCIQYAEGSTSTSPPPTPPSRYTHSLLLGHRYNFTHNAFHSSTIGQAPRRVFTEISVTLKGEKKDKKGDVFAIKWTSERLVVVGASHRTEERKEDRESLFLILSVHEAYKRFVYGNTIYAVTR